MDSRNIETTERPKNNFTHQELKDLQALPIGNFCTCFVIGQGEFRGVYEQIFSESDKYIRKN